MNCNSINKPIILGLDISFKRTGWALTDIMKLKDYGIIVPPKEFKNVTHKDKEFSKFLKWYQDRIQLLVNNIVLVEKKLNYAVIEELNMEFVRAAKPILQVHAAAKIGIIMGYALTDISYIHNRTLKAFFEMPMFKKKKFSKDVVKKSKELKKRPEKILMIDIINRMYELNLSYKQDDEADAIALCVTKYCQLMTPKKKRKK
jgi:Holliday junction resolvasome RuvABC endonuclease subunit